MTQPKGPQGFDAFYSAIYGNRWPQLKTALFSPRRAIAFDEGLKTPYYLDKASILCAQVLPLSENSVVGDFCAAPGGKTLVLASKLPPGTLLIANEKSSARRSRLVTVINQHLPSELRNPIQIRGWDATRFGRTQPEYFDSILLDVPCSSERHLLEQPRYLAQWGPGRGKNLAIQALALAASALDSLKRGGYLLYSTCSLNPEENDGVWDKMSKKRTGWTKVDLPDLPGEATRWGRIILPDQNDGMGPLYLTLVRKTPENLEQN